MTKIDFEAPAGVYGSSGRKGPSRRQGLTFRRFPTLAEAVKYAVEEQASHFAMTAIEVEDLRLDADEIRRLYDSPDFPLARREQH
jgi:hypothetical protein